MLCFCGAWVACPGACGRRVCVARVVKTHRALLMETMHLRGVAFLGHLVRFRPSGRTHRLVAGSPLKQPLCLIRSVWPFGRRALDANACVRPFGPETRCVEIAEFPFVRCATTIMCSGLARYDHYLSHVWDPRCTCLETSDIPDSGQTLNVVQQQLRTLEKQQSSLHSELWEFRSLETLIAFISQCVCFGQAGLPRKGHA